jgi:hypothetical protein
MRLLSLLASFFLGKLNHTRSVSLKETVLIIFEEVTSRSRKPVILLLSGLACILILCGGLFMSIIDLTSQFDREGSLRFTASFASGGILLTISLGVFFWIFTSAWPETRSKIMIENEAPQATASALEQALSLLVIDFIKEREYKREQRMPPEPRREKEPPPHHNN